MADPTPAADVLAEIELARRRFELLERRITGWERRLTRLEEALGVEAPDPAADLSRFEGLEARVSRLERKRFEALAARRRALETDRDAADEAPPATPPTDLSDARALVFPEWRPPRAEPGAEVILEVMIDGLAPDETVRFTVVEQGRADAEPIVLEAPAGEGDRVEVRWTPPAPDKRRKTRSFVFRATAAGLETRSSVLTVG